MSETEARKIYVLDTNVLIHDPRALSQFDEHDVVLPIAVLEEMDKVKRGFDEAARNVREVSRQLDDLSEHCTQLEDGCPLPGGGRLFFELNHRALEILPESLAKGSGDNRIIAVTMSLQQEHADREVVLVSKDINLRIKARALGLKSEDYRSDRVVVEDMDILPLGYMELDEETWTAMAEDMSVTDSAAGSHYRVKWPEHLTPPCVNGFVVLPGEREQALRCTEVEEDGHVHLHDIRSYRTERHAVWGIQARNLEQNMAMNLLMDADLDMVTLLGRAGSGKTLLALACGLQQTLDQDLYDRIIVTRATVPMGQDIGYLPGTEKEKLEPWMGAVSDNLSLLLEDDFQGMGDLSQYSIEISSLSFARGRTFTRTWLIVDEAQNLTPHQMKTLITRIGEGSKIIILGNNAQIDTPYLTAQTNGLTMAVMRFAYWPHSGHVTLKASERSRLAAYAAEVM